uniref:Uncharacterized protein n=1 Tax=Lotus japonicus TaxID=34305 RepID=I3S2N5_LOTJA|nr:unknown [Lotus japonicus]
MLFFSISLPNSLCLSLAYSQSQLTRKDNLYKI